MQCIVTHALALFRGCISEDCDLTLTVTASVSECKSIATNSANLNLIWFLFFIPPCWEVEQKPDTEP